MTKSENIIRGSCPDFVCRCCRTKYGWAHQIWCDEKTLLEPGCKDCQYGGARGKCSHPARRTHHRKRRENADEKA